MRRRRRTTAAQHDTTQHKPSTAAIRFAVARKPITAPAHHVGSYEGCREAADLVQYLSCLCGFPPRRVTGCRCAGRKVRLVFFFIAPPSLHMNISPVSPHQLFYHTMPDTLRLGGRSGGGENNRKRKSHTARKSPQIWGAYS